MAVFGAGPVGLLTIACARLLGAEQIFVVDHHAWRLRFAEERYGAIPINFDDENDPAEKNHRADGRTPRRGRGN